MKKLTPIIIAGVEIECEYNQEAIGHICHNGYHSRDMEKFSKNFIAESDGSICQYQYDNAGTTELISLPFDLKDRVSILDEFREETKKRYDLKQKGRVKSILKLRGKYPKFEDIPLNDIFNFNKSTGCHIHLSFLAKGREKDAPRIFTFKGKRISRKCSSFKFQRVVTFNVLKRIKKTIADRVKEELPKVYPEWFKQYDDRSYAVKTNKINRNNRQVDWNFTGGRSDHVEFRAFNLNGVKNWEDFYKIFDIAFSTIKEEIQKELCKAKAFSETKTNTFSVNTDTKKKVMKLKGDCEYGNIIFKRDVEIAKGRRQKCVTSI